MALDLGTLVGYLDLDDSAFNGTIDKMPAKLQNGGKIAAGAMIGVGVAVAAAFGKGVLDAINMEASNNKVAAQMGLTATESARVGTLAGEVYAQNYGESVEQVQSTVAGVVKDIQGMGDASDGAVSKMTANILSFSSAFEVDAASAITQVNQLIQSGLAKDGTHALDLLTSAMQKVPEALRGDMVDAIDEYAPHMAAMGFSGEEAFDLLVKGAEKGMYGIDKTGDALKEFGILTTTDLKRTGPAFEAIGLDADKMANRFLAGGDSAKSAFDETIKALLAVEDPADRAQQAIALFGTPLEDLSTSDIPNFLQGMLDAGSGMEDVSGAAQAMSDKMGEGAAAGWETFNRQVEIVMATLGEALLPVLTEVFAFLSSNPEIIKNVALGLGMFAIALGVAAAAQWVMNSALLASPITWLIVAIMALIGAIVLIAMNWDAVVAGISDGWASLMQKFAEGGQQIIDFWNGLWTAVWEWIVAVWGEIMGFVGEVITNWNNLWTGVWEWIVEVWNGIMAFISVVLAAILDTFLNWTLVGLIIQYWDEIAAATSAVWNGIIQFLTGFITNVIAGFVKFGTDLSTGLRNIWTAISTTVSTAWNGIVSFLSGIISAIGAAFAAFGSNLVLGLSVIWSNISSAVSSAWNNIVSFLTATISNIRSFFTTGFNAIVSTLSTVWSNVSSGVSTAWGNIMSFFAGIPGKILGYFSGIGSWLYSAGRDLINGLLNGVKSLAGTIGSFFLGLLPDWIKGPFKAAMGIHSPSRVFAEYGRNTVQGYLNGVEELKGDLDSEMRALVEVPEAGSTISLRRVAAAAEGGAGASGDSRTVNYYAAEHQSLSNEEALFAALSSPRVGG